MNQTEIRINEHGDEVHDSWLLIRANHVSSHPGVWLFDSEIQHQRLITVEITRCSRKRTLNRDWLHSNETLLQMEMSQAQWGAFVSSFGNGNGVPATLSFLHGEGSVPQAPPQSRFEETHTEVRESGTKALSDITRSYEKVMEAFDAGGKRALRAALVSLGAALQNAPSNMEFAAKSLTEHAEAVVTKARADIEAMALSSVEQRELSEPTQAPQLGHGDPADSDGGMDGPDGY